MNHSTPSPSDDEIRLHLARLNWASYESYKYLKDAYDQRNGQPWFRDACEREERETRWLLNHGVRLVFFPATSTYEVLREDGTQR